MTPETMFIFFISMLLMWIKPGPAQLLKIAVTLERGLPSGILFSLGSALMCSIFFIAAALGYKALSDVFNYTGFFLQIFGAIYLSYLGVKGLFRIYKNPNSFKSKAKKAIGSKENNVFFCFVMGMLAVLSSPFWIFYFIGVLPSLISLEDIASDSFLIGASLVFVSGVIVDWPMLTLVTQLQRTYVDGKFEKYMNAFISVIFLVIAGVLIYSAFFVEEFSFDINDVL